LSRAGCPSNNTNLQSLLGSVNFVGLPSGGLRLYPDPKMVTLIKDSDPDRQNASALGNITLSPIEVGLCGAEAGQHTD